MKLKRRNYVMSLKMGAVENCWIPGLVYKKCLNFTWTDEIFIVKRYPENQCSTKYACLFCSTFILQENFYHSSHFLSAINHAIPKYFDGFHKTGSCRSSEKVESFHILTSAFTTSTIYIWIGWRVTIFQALSVQRWFLCDEIDLGRRSLGAKCFRGI